MGQHAYSLPEEPEWGFVGRDDELARLDAELSADGGRSAWIPGRAGMGKTALAVHWARTRAARYPGGLLYIDLRDREHVHGALLEAVRALTGQPAWDAGFAAVLGQYQRLLAGRQVLVIFDNVPLADEGSAREHLAPSEGASAVIMTSCTG